MITLDTSGIVALASSTDQHHEQATSELSADAGPFLVPAGVLAEATYMLERRGGPEVVDRFLGDIENGGLSLHCGNEDIGRARELIHRYSDLPLGFADAAVIACAERHGGRVLSFDRDFAVVAREGTIEILPPA